MADNDLHREVGELQGTVQALTKEVESLRGEVKELLAILNQGRGAKYLLFILPSVIGAASAIIGYFGLHWTVR